MRYLFACLISIVLLASCQDRVVVKPAAQLRLEYPEATYAQAEFDCNYSFSVNQIAELQQRNNCWVNVHYPAIDATIYLTYRPVENNLDSLLFDAQKLTYDHTVKANKILEQPRIDPINKVYGMFYMIDGDAATQSQFYVTDSINHFVTGSVYFNAKPNFDSILPAVEYLRNDVRRMMESMSWEE
ncbi:gliding motility lipoprotein GldD [Gilvibacter sediminis]|uniref:gliding motility lipoprotein GldD n=1 Tax=Gilvibacter sediminis TaxID=379071 RepID=UPI0023500235|nr:gliding motility lipoprotein GldD [Gilvibacter sediminis]MDC7997161.1 gliding motility lipoprotein GldD [Gilvibacter sediminis]